MLFTDMDMLQDYEKDTRMAATGYRVAETDILDPQLRALIGKIGEAAANSHKKSVELILMKGDRP